MNQKLLIALSFILMLGACQKENELNQLPSAPVLSEPEDGAVTGSKAAWFRWHASTDKENNLIAYFIAFSTDQENWEEYRTIDTFYYEDQFASGTKYYWKVRAENKWDGVVEPEEEGESVSGIFHFYTSPRNVSALSDTSGNGFVNLSWKDITDMDYAEITFSPEASGITQPIKVNAGTQKAEITGLENGTLYSFYIKTYNTAGHVSLPDTIQSLPLGPQQVHDADYNIYTTVQIGDQVWLGQNLRTTKWQDGTEMVDKYLGDLYKIGSKSDIYGNYYSPYYALGMDEFDKNPCPCSYHIPTDEEWKELETYLEIPEEDLNDYCNFSDEYRGEEVNAGKILKSSTGWNEIDGINGNGSDLYGFNLLPAGIINFDGEYEVGEYAMLYTSTIADSPIYIFRAFSSSSTGIRYCQSSYFASIRCIKDKE